MVYVSERGMAQECISERSVAHATKSLPGDHALPSLFHGHEQFIRMALSRHALMMMHAAPICTSDRQCHVDQVFAN